jgi:hypothetical protein
MDTQGEFNKKRPYVQQQKRSENEIRLHFTALIHSNFLSAFYFSLFLGGIRNKLWRNTAFWINNKLQQTFKGRKYKNPYGAA